MNSVANWPKVRLHNSKKGGRANQWPNRDLMFPERTEKGPNFEPVLVLLLFPYECIEKLDFSEIFSLKWMKTIGPILIKPEK
jgi:hypothetical protein